MANIDLSGLTPQELKELAAQASKQANEVRNTQRAAYEEIKKATINSIASRITELTRDMEVFKTFLKSETQAFYEVMKEYGELKAAGQDSFTICDDTFKIEVKYKKCKAFDERADIAAKRLIEFLNRWIETAEKGKDNPMYKITMSLLKRNSEGELDYKSISVLYASESEFNSPEYSEIMTLFRESNVIESTKYYYSFYEKGEYGGWDKIEPSFSRIK